MVAVATGSHDVKEDAYGWKFAWETASISQEAWEVTEVPGAILQGLSACLADAVLF